MSAFGAPFLRTRDQMFSRRQCQDESPRRVVGAALDLGVRPLIHSFPLSLEWALFYKDQSITAIIELQLSGAALQGSVNQTKILVTCCAASFPAHWHHLPWFICASEKQLTLLIAHIPWHATPQSCKSRFLWHLFPSSDLWLGCCS